MRGVVTRGRSTVPQVVSGFSALEASSFSDASFPFFLGEFFNADRVNVHGVWINFGALVVGVVSLNKVGVVGFLQSNGICSVPGGFEVNGTGVPIIDLGGYHVHTINLLHKGSRDAS